VREAQKEKDSTDTWILFRAKFAEIFTDIFHASYTSR
jgi:hypothetical protein